MRLWAYFDCAMKNLSFCTTKFVNTVISIEVVEQQIASQINRVVSESEFSIKILVHESECLIANIFTIEK